MRSSALFARLPIHAQILEQNCLLFSGLKFKKKIIIQLFLYGRKANRKCLGRRPRTGKLNSKFELIIYLIFLKQRWQRRWFVLYDDGELTYSVDEHVSF